MGGIAGYVAGVVVCSLLVAVALAAITVLAFGRWRHKLEKGQQGVVPEAPCINTGGSSEGKPVLVAAVL